MALFSADSDDLLELESIFFYARVLVYNEWTRGNEMLQIVKLEHANREYTGRRTYDIYIYIYIYIYIENAPSFTASVGLAQARPNDIIIIYIFTSKASPLPRCTQLIAV